MLCYAYLLPLWPKNIQKELNLISQMCICVSKGDAGIHVWMCCQIVNGYIYLLPLWPGNIQKELNLISHMCMCLTSLIESGAGIHVWMCCKIVNGCGYQLKDDFSLYFTCKSRAIT